MNLCPLLHFGFWPLHWDWSLRPCGKWCSSGMQCSMESWRSLWHWYQRLYLDCWGIDIRPSWAWVCEHGWVWDENRGVSVHVWNVAAHCTETTNNTSLFVTLVCFVLCVLYCYLLSDHFIYLVFTRTQVESLISDCSWSCCVYIIAVVDPGAAPWGPVFWPWAHSLPARETLCSCLTQQ